jgi:hypothetical protein
VIGAPGSSPPRAAPPRGAAPSAGPGLPRREALARGARLGLGVLAVPFVGALSACARSAPVRRPLVVLAERRPDREARIALWNDGAGAAGGVPLELQHVPYGAGSEDTRAAVAAGSLRADLIWADLHDLPPLSLAGQLRRLSPLVRRSRFDLKRFMPAALGPAYGPDAQLVALPDEVDARQLYYNLDHFDAAGLDPRAVGFDFERPGLTWEGLRQVDLDLLSAPGPADRIPFVTGHEGAPLEMWGWQNGATWLDAGGRRARFTQPEALAALSWLVAHARELGGGDRATGTDFPPISRNGDATDEPLSHPFLRTAVSVCFESTRLVSTVAGWHPGFPLGYVEPPRRWLGRPLVSLSRAWGYGLHRDAPDAAWEALQVLVSAPAITAGAAAAAALAPVAAAPDPSLPPPSRPLPQPGRPLWYPPYSGQLTVDRLVAARFNTGSKLLDEARNHGLEQLRHARFRPPSPAPHAVWPLLTVALRQALKGTPPAEALAAAGLEAQNRLDAAWKSAATR